ncbi:MAG: hypothetical protein KA204_04945 [Chromatiaceae bacterium]|nr:hypothetical protein [Chromatiaceae bacterium]MBP6733508.1 hypothetical protein [Chromatiaceae bacterium]MBP6806934.1 hypothetical protein [Chromatiaceae bacterium]MBP8283095.1 hypothetical protein [Chromatiaceae bacterium]MBP8288434.1 hypothetical protein [Chromatiaceae bacterium]
MTDPHLALVEAINTLDEVADEILFLSVAVVNAWDDKPAAGLVYLLDRLRLTLKATSATVCEANAALRIEGPTHG